MLSNVCESKISIHKEVDIDLTFEPHSLIGEGAFSNVYKLKWNNKECAYKVQSRIKKSERALLREVTYLRFVGTI